MRQVKEMAVEFVNALNAAAAAELVLLITLQSECAKLRRLLEEQRKLMQRLKEEKEEEAQMARRKIERMSQRLAEAQKDVEYASARADVAENEWVKLKRELQEALQFVELLKPESKEMTQSVLRQVDDKELELANAINAASIAESECDKLRRMLEEGRKLVQGLKLEKDDEAQLAKRQIEELGQELGDARKYAEYMTPRADVAEHECAKLKRMLEEEQKFVQRLRIEKDDEAQLAKRQIEEIDKKLALAQKDAELARKDADAAENEWTKVKRDLKNMEEHVKLMELQCQETRERASRPDEEKALELANALNASVIAESECAKLKRMLIEEGKTVQRLRIEKDDEVELAKRQIEKMGQELAYARKEAQYARNDADIAENEWGKVKRELKEKKELVELLTLEIQETRQILEDARKEAEYARNDADIAENEWGKVKRELKEKEELIELLKLEIQEARQILENALREAEHAQNDADLAKNEWIKAKKDLQEKLELIQLLKLECQETRESAKRQVEEKELELADALNAATAAPSSSAAAQECVICLTNEKDMAFGCGHMTCEECGTMLDTCPICRVEITCRIKLYPG
ncbi:myosin-6-like isoform X8 [Neltuma alba]|uniref:myosin-6-like isoform X8 n=1 Tax=Neltuma alba TaxID=207710 RepID=UPI0010A4C102|nr:myosin-6-like isoform X8 [Prosopis alba]